MSERNMRSRSVQPRQVPRASEEGSIPNTLSAPLATQGNTQQEGDLINLTSRVMDLERNMAKIIETQLERAMENIVRRFNRGDNLDINEATENVADGRQNTPNINEAAKKAVDEISEEKNSEEDDFVSIHEETKKIIKMPKAKIEPKLSGQKNYLHWKLMVIGQMKATNIVDAVENKLDEKNLSNIYALDFITRSISGIMIPHIIGVKTAYEAWNKLESYCAPKSATEIRRLRKDLSQLKLRGDNKIDEYIAQVRQIREELANQEIYIDDSEMISHLLNGLGRNYETLSQIIENENGTLEDAFSKIRMLARKYSGDGNQEESEKALFCHKKGTKKCSKCGKSGHVAEKCGLKCSFCKYFGHSKEHCRKLKRLETEKNNNEGMKNSEEEAAIALCAMKTSKSENCWILDSGATTHISNKKELFQNMKEENVSVGQLEGRELIGIGSGRIHISEELILEKVLYVPNAKYCLISVSKLISNGYKVIFDSDVASLEKEDCKTVVAERKGNLYIIKNIEIANLATKEIKLQTLHKRLGHQNYKLIKFIAKRENLQLEDNEEEICASCVKGKMARKPFKQAPIKEREFLDLIHTDIAGPLEQKSIGGSRYFVTFIDDKSHFKWIYFMEFKNELYPIFRKFILMVKNQFEKIIKAIRSDNGSEYLSSDFQSIINEFGILHQRTMIYSPQQNGVAERLNRTIMDMTRTMLVDSNLPKILWAEAANTSIYLLNRTYNQKIKESPYKFVHRRNSDIMNFKIFGCKVIIQIPTEKRKKLDNHGESGFFVGYDYQDDGYRIYLLEKNIITRSRDVVFFENVFHKGNKLAESDQEISIGNIQLAFLSLDGSPESYHEAIQNENKLHWKNAMDEEFNSLVKNQTWQLVPRPKGRNVITGKWVYKIKRGADGNIERYKARWVARGFTQIKGVDYLDVFAPTARNSTTVIPTVERTRRSFFENIFNT